MRLAGIWLVFMGMSLLRGAEAPGPGTLLKPAWELGTNRFTGEIRQIALDPRTAEAFIGTSTKLYRFQDGREEPPPVEPPAGSLHLLLAPGGDLIAWLLPHPEVSGLYRARVTDVTGNNPRFLQLEEFPHGIGGAYLGLQGKFIVTASPLDDREGMNGRFLYTFWKADGTRRGEVRFPESQSVVLDRAGQAAVFLGESRAACHDAAGGLVWSLDGTFRDGALAADGKLAVLCPSLSGNLRAVWIFRGTGEPTKVEAPAPVQGVRIAPDLSRALLLGPDARYFILRLAGGEVSEGAELPADGACRIMDADFVGPDRLAFGVRLRTGTPAEPRWLEAATIAVDLKGKALVRQELKPSAPVGGFPRIVVDVRGRSYVAYTVEQAMCFKFGQ
jgi:hypothetical protein